MLTVRGVDMVTAPSCSESWIVSRPACPIRLGVTMPRGVCSIVPALSVSGTAEAPSFSLGTAEELLMGRAEALSLKLSLGAAKFEPEAGALVLVAGAAAWGLSPKLSLGMRVGEAEAAGRLEADAADDHDEPSDGPWLLDKDSDPLTSGSGEYSWICSCAYVDLLFTHTFVFMS